MSCSFSSSDLQTFSTVICSNQALVRFLTAQKGPPTTLSKQQLKPQQVHLLSIYAMLRAGKFTIEVLSIIVGTRQIKPYERRYRLENIFQVIVRSMMAITCFVCMSRVWQLSSFLLVLLASCPETNRNLPAFTA